VKVLDLDEVAREQELLSRLVIHQDDLPFGDSIITGVDVSYSENHAVGCAVVSNTRTHEILNTITLETEVECEYISGFFQLREGPIILKLLNKITDPGIILVDGNGILHPRHFGLASYLGVKRDIPTIGVAKKLMLGEIGPRSTDTADITHEGTVLGRVLWSEEKKPIYISIGHRVSLDTAVRIVRESSVNNYPEVLRQAHRISKIELK
jgi:deoxyribonuclease V